MAATRSRCACHMYRGHIPLLFWYLLVRNLVGASGAVGRLLPQRWMVRVAPRSGPGVIRTTGEEDGGAWPARGGGTTPSPTGACKLKRLAPRRGGAAGACSAVPAPSPGPSHPSLCSPASWGRASSAARASSEAPRPGLPRAAFPGAKLSCVVPVFPTPVSFLIDISVSDVDMLKILHYCWGL